VDCALWHFTLTLFLPGVDPVTPGRQGQFGGRFYIDRLAGKAVAVASLEWRVLKADGLCLGGKIEHGEDLVLLVAARERRRANVFMRGNGKGGPDTLPKQGTGRIRRVGF